MKTWQFWVIVIIVILVIIPLIYYAVTVKTLGKVVSENPSLLENNCSGISLLAKPPIGKTYVCKNGSWQLISI